MSIEYKAWVSETGTLTGTDPTYTLPGTASTPSGNQFFRKVSAAFTATATVVLTITAATGAETSVWTYTPGASGAAGTITRVTLLESSTGSTINWSGVTANISGDIPSPVLTSAGAASAGLVAALNATGQIDPSMLATTLLDVQNGPGTNGGAAFTIATSSFVTVPFTTVNVDTASGWSTTNNQYTIPFTGIYIIITKLRPIDNVSVYSYGQGVNFNNNVDGPWFFWANTYTGASDNRNGTVNTRIVQATAGQVLNMYAYATANGNMNSAQMNIVRVD